MSFIVNMFMLGTPEGIRTPDLWYRNSKNWSLRECVTGVESVLSVWKRQWILGLVAVSVAVRCLEHPLGELAIFGLLDSGSSMLPIDRTAASSIL
jgi:hypothetical protein